MIYEERNEMIVIESTKPSATLQFILETAESLIQEKGCRQTTLQDIIERTGLSKGAIYHDVSGKDELFGMILKTNMSMMYEQFHSIVAESPGADVTNPVRFITDQIGVQTGKDDAASKIFIYLLSQNDNPKVAAILGSVYDFSYQMTSQWIEFGKEAGVIPQEVQTEKIAALFMSFLYGMRVQIWSCKKRGGTGRHG